MGDLKQRPSVADVCADLAQEHRDLDGVVVELSEADWALPTPAPGWDVRDQIGHLAYFDRQAFLAVSDPEAFATGREAAEESGWEAFASSHLEIARNSTPAAVVAEWRRSRAEMLDVLSTLDPHDRIGWYGPDMGALTFVSARLMETWAHGQDVVDALGIGRHPTTRLRHICELGVRTRSWSYEVRRMEPPASAARVELLAPDGETWVIGADVADDLVRGSALDFCLVVTQRRNLADTDLVATGPRAVEWLALAQVFAGPPGTGRRAGEFG
ncbi:MAG: TIGR03084 family metal-binding protein [Acidimicrobiia bacterium]